MSEKETEKELAILEVDNAALRMIVIALIHTHVKISDFSESDLDSLELHLVQYQPKFGQEVYRQVDSKKVDKLKLLDQGLKDHQVRLLKELIEIYRKLKMYL